jgi:WD40 repeat protein
MRLLSAGQRVSHLEFSPDGRFLAAWGAWSEARFWDLRSAGAGPWSRRLAYRFDFRISPLGAAWDGRWLCLGPARQPGGVVEIEPIDLGLVLERLRQAPQEGPHGLPHDLPPDLPRSAPLKWAPQGTSSYALGHTRPLFLAVTSGALAAWDFERGERVLVADGLSVRFGTRLWLPTEPISLSADDRWLAVTASQADVPLIDVASGATVARLSHPYKAHRALFAPTGTLLATAGAASRTVRLWDAATGRCLAAFKAFRKWCRALAFHPSGRALAAGSDDGLVRVWDTASFREVACHDWQIGEVTALAFAPDGMTAAAAGHKGRVVMWDVDL